MRTRHDRIPLACAGCDCTSLREPKYQPKITDRTLRQADIVRYLCSMVSRSAAPAPSLRSDVAVVLMGLPGSGKGTQAQLLETAGWSHINVGGLVRSEIAAGTEWGAQVLTTMQRGDLVPSQDVQRLIAKAMNSVDLPVVIEGYPRRLSEADTLPYICGPETMIVPFFLDVPLATALARVAQRLLCHLCGWVTKERLSTICARCGGSLISRNDDNVPGTVARRLEIFKCETVPLVELYRSNGQLEIIKSVRTELEVHEQILIRIRNRCAVRPSGRSTGVLQESWHVAIRGNTLK